MTGKEASDFFKDKFKQSLRKDMIFWISLIVSVVGIAIYYILETSWYANFVEFLYFNWSIFGLWIGALFLLTRNYNDSKNLKSHHLKSLCRILLLVLLIIMPHMALFVLPVLGIWWVIEVDRKNSSNEDAALEKSSKSTSEKSSKPTSKIALVSFICNALAVPLLFGITILQERMISSGLLHRTDALASAGIGFWTGIILSVTGIILWTISRKHEGRHVWNFWAMRLIIVNVILAPFVLFFIFAVAITRAK